MKLKIKFYFMTKYFNPRKGGSQRDGNVVLRNERPHFFRGEWGVWERDQGCSVCEEDPEVLDDKLEAGSQTQHTGLILSVTVLGTVCINLTTLLVVSVQCQPSACQLNVSLLTSLLSEGFYHKTLIVKFIWRDIYGSISQEKWSQTETIWSTRG